MDTCTISRKQKTSLVKPKFSETWNTIPWHKKKQNKSSERKNFNFDQAKIFMKDEVRMQLVRCTERNKSPSSDGMTGLWGTRRDLACLAFYCCRHNITTSILGRKGSVHFTIYSPSSGETKQELEEDGNLESGAETETVKELCLHWLALCLTQITTTCPGTALSPAGWAVTSIINQENGAQTCLQANVVRVFFSIEVSLPRWHWVVSVHRKTNQCSSLSCQCQIFKWS